MELTSILIAIGICLFSAIVLLCITKIFMKEQTYEELLEEQRKKNVLLFPVQKNKEKKKDKKGKKKIKTSDEQPMLSENLTRLTKPINDNLNSEKHKSNKTLQLEIDPEEIIEHASIRNRKKQKPKLENDSKDIHGILLNKDEKIVVKKGNASETHFKIIPKDYIELEYDRRSRNSSISEHVNGEIDPQIKEIVKKQQIVVNKESNHNKKKLDELIKELAGISLSEKELKNLMVVLNLDDKVNVMKKANFDKLQDKISSKEMDLKDEIKKRQSFEKSVLELTNELSKLKSKFSMDTENLRNENDNLRTNLEILNNKKLSEIEQLHRQLIDSSEKCKQLQQQTNIVNNELKKQVAKNSTATSLINKLETQEKQFKANNSEIEKKLHSEIDSLKKKNESIENFMNQQLKYANDKLQESEKECSSLKNRIMEIENNCKENSIVNDELTSLREEKKKLENELILLSKEISEKDEAFENKITPLRDEKKKLDNELILLRKENSEKDDAFENKIAELKLNNQQEYESFSKNKESEKNSEIDLLKKENTILKNNCNEMGEGKLDNEKMISELNEKLNEKILQIQTLQNDIMVLCDSEKELKLNAENQQNTLPKSFLEKISCFFSSENISEDELCNFIQGSLNEVSDSKTRITQLEDTLIKTKEKLKEIEENVIVDQKHFNEEKQKLEDKLKEKEEELEKLGQEKLQTTIELGQYKDRLNVVEREKLLLQSKLSESSTSLNKIKEELKSLEILERENTHLKIALDEEKKQSLKLLGKIKTGCDSLLVEQNRVKHLEEQLKINNYENGAIDTEKHLDKLHSKLENTQKDLDEEIKANVRLSERLGALGVLVNKKNTSNGSRS